MNQREIVIYHFKISSFSWKNRGLRSGGWFCGGGSSPGRVDRSAAGPAVTDASNKSITASDDRFLSLNLFLLLLSHPERNKLILTW